jgi:hypothetical protein
MKIYLLTYKSNEKEACKISNAYTSYSSAVKEYKNLKEKSEDSPHIELENMDVAISVHDIKGKKELFELFKKLGI